MAAKTIVFVHGMYMTPLCWEHWVERFSARGFACLAPAWPGRDEPVEVLRAKHPDTRLGELTLEAIVDAMTQRIAALAEPPVLIGHSMGALVVQLLLQRGLGAAGVVVSSAPPQGVMTTKWSFLRSNWPHITPFAAIGRPIEMSFPRFQYTFVNAMHEPEQRAAFERYVVPESRRVPRQSLTRAAKVGFAQLRSPLLFVAGSADHIIPASLNVANAAKYRRAGAAVDLEEFDGRTHFIIGQPGWEEVADFAAGWIDSHVP